MVFKTICVGSIPATLVIVIFNSLTRKKKTLYRSKYKQLRRKLNITYSYLGKKTVLRRLQKIDPSSIFIYRKSRRLKNVKRRGPKIFKFRNFARLHKNFTVRLKQLNSIRTVRPLTSTTLFLNLPSATVPRPIKVNAPERPHITSTANNKSRRKKSTNIIALGLLKRSNEHLPKSSPKGKIWANNLRRQLGNRPRKKKQALFYSKISGYKNPQTTRSYKLEYNEKFSASFSKNCKNVLKSQPFLDNYPFYNTSALVLTLSIFSLQKTFNTLCHTHYSDLLGPKNLAAYAPELIKFSTFTYSQQLRNLLSSNTMDYIHKLNTPNNSLAWPNGKLHPTAHSVPSTNKNLSSLTEGQVAQGWSLESDFVRRKNLKAPNAVFVLGKAPTYRMSKNSESPISTSQQNGNFFNSWSRLPCLRSSTLALFSKSNISSFVSKFNRPKPSIKPEQMFSTVHTLLNNGLTTQRKLSLRKLTYVRPTTSVATQSLPLLSTKSHSKALMGMKQITISVRKKTRNYSGVRPKPLRKQKLLSRNLISSRRRQLRLKRLLKRNVRRMGRFLRWKAKKAALFFTKCTKMSRNRKKHIKKLYRSMAVSSRTMKHNSFNTNIILPTRHTLSIKGLLTNPNTTRLPMKSLTTLLIGSNGISHAQASLFLISNPLLLKSFIFPLNGANNYKDVLHLSKQFLSNIGEAKFQNTNLTPHQAFNKVFTKKVLNSFANRLFRDDIIPLYQNTLIRFIEFCTGKKAMFQFYPFVNQHIDKAYMVRYKRWLPRMGFYERRLGHRFFLEESLHIIHISFVLRDPKIIASWLRAMILRISFWKTRSIFRFLKYLFHNYFIHVFDDVRIKGLKIRLKGKISAAGNSRKRTILYRIGNTSHSEVNLRVVKDFSLINTFTGVMGFQVYLFY